MHYRTAFLALALSAGAANAQKSAATAGTLSAVVPGLSLGSYYVGEPGNALIMTLGIATSIGLTAYAAKQVYLYNGQETPNCFGAPGCIRQTRSVLGAVGGVGLTLAIYGASIVVARDGAGRYNARPRAERRAAILPVVLPDGKGREHPGAQLTLRF